MDSPVPVPFSGKGLQQSPRRRNCEPSIWVKNPVADAESGTSRQDCSQTMGKQAKSDIAAAAATDAGARKRASLTALALMFLLDEALLVATSASLWFNGISPLPFVPMIINRASETAVVIGTQHPVHIVLGALQTVLAVAAGALFAYADGTCHSISSAFDDSCSIVLICLVIFLCEVVVLWTEVMIHMPWRRLGASANPHQKGAQSLPTHAAKQGAGTNSTIDMKPFAPEMLSAKQSALASMERGCDSPLAMQPWDISASAAAAIDWLREGAVVTDWWQMPQEEARDSASITVRGMGGEAIVLEDTPSFQHMPGKGGSKRDSVVITGIQQLQVSTINETTEDAFACSPSSSSTETPKQDVDTSLRLSLEEPYGPSPMQSFRATSPSP